MASLNTDVCKFKRLSHNAYPPKKYSLGAAGYDLFSPYEHTIGPGDKCLCFIDLQVQVPSGYYGRIAPRSGLAVKNFIDVGAGVIDSDYRGNVGVLLFNFGKDKFHIRKGDRIAQLIIEKIGEMELIEVESLDVSVRDKDGFGSTDVKNI